jgi:ferredoxin like protein
MKTVSVAHKLAVNKYELDEGHPHIEVNNEVCQAKCGDKFCLFVCPANVYQEQGDKIIADWAGCLECTTCKVACPSDALHWEYPRGGFGIVYRHG